MMPNTVAISTGLVPHISRMVAGRAVTRVIHQRLPMVMFHHRHQQHRPQRPANCVQQTASYSCTGSLVLDGLK